MPASWSHEKKEREMLVPAWLVKMIYTCLEKEPSKRFANGTAIQDFIHSSIIAEENKIGNVSTEQLTIARTNELQLKKQIEKLELQAAERDDLVGYLQMQIEKKDKEIEQYQYASNYNLPKPKRAGISKSLFAFILLIALGVGGFTTYDSLIRPEKAKKITRDTIAHVQPVSAPVDSAAVTDSKTVKKIKPKLKKNTAPALSKWAKKQPEKQLSENASKNDKPVGGKEYRIMTKAFIHSAPDVETRTNVFIFPGKETVTAMDEKDDFIYVSFVNSGGKTTKGWLLKKNLNLVNEY